MNRPEFQNHRTLGVDLERLLREIRMGHTSSGEELCRLLKPGVQFLVARHSRCANHAEIVDKVLTKLLEAIGRGQVHDVSELLRHARMTIVNADVTAETRGTLNSPGDSDSPNPAPRNPQFEGMRVALAEMPEQEREILRRYYALGQTEEQILAALRLSRSQFQALKLRAKARLQSRGSGQD